MYVIKTKYGNIGCVYNNKPYVIGFEKRYHATKVRKILTNPPIISLERNNLLDVTNEIRQGLLEYGIDKLKIPQVTIDTNAELFIGKAGKDNALYDECELELMENFDFMMLSFNKNIGIIMPYEESNENEHVMVYTANVVDPSINIDDFRNTLHL